MSIKGRFLSSSWYRVAALTPRLREHVKVRPHRYRGRHWYVISDGMGDRVHRLSPAAYMLIAAMDGTRSLDDLWSEAAIANGEQAPTQDQVIQLLGRLHANDLVAGNVPPDAHELFERRRQIGRNKVLQWVLNPLSIRIPLMNPNELLAETMPFVRPLTGWTGGILWLVTVLPALLLTARYWPDLTENMSDHVLSPKNLLLIAIVYPLIKLMHELGHGYVTRAYGGEVHETGIMLLVLLPMPYVDVSSAAGFRRKSVRYLVGAAGIMVELFVASVAFYVWLLVEPGLVRAIAFNAMLAASVSSLLFNANPLLRYDGYYILSDLIEIPNLAQRGTQYWSYLVYRYAFGLRGVDDFAATRGERIWFLFYTPTAAIYRAAVTIAVALFLMSKYLMVGVVLALWGIATGICLPAVRGVWSIVSAPGLRNNRFRALSVTGAVLIGGLAIGFWLPVPLHTDAEGVLWLPDDAIVRAGSDGFIREVRATPGSFVSRGQALIESADPDLNARVQSLRGRKAEIAAKLASVRFTDRVEAIVNQIELDAVSNDLAREEHRQSLLEAKARTDGTFVMPLSEDAEGRFFRRGQVLGYTLPPDGARIVRAMVTQEDIDLIRQGVRSVKVRLENGLDDDISVHTLREVPGGGDQLPSVALGTAGGGTIPVDPRDEHGMTALNRVFQIELELPSSVIVTGFGGRAYVRFDHEWEPLAVQLWRRARQLLLSRVAL